MTQNQCPFEAEILAAALEQRWPEHTAAPLREHAAGCPVCSDAIAVAAAFDGARERTLSSASLPDAGRVWRQAQLRARREAVEAAGRPITAAQVIAFACAMGLLGACFGATSSWFQSLLRWDAGFWGSLDKTAWLASSLALISSHGVWLLAGLAVVCLVPTVVYVALGRD